jgi:uncharacterized membrane protein YccC
LRIEDVAIGCLVSVAVGLLFWPRGVASLVGDDLGDAYRAGAVYLREAVQWVSGARAQPPQSGPGALVAGVRLDDALRAFMAEQGTKHVATEELWRLVGGTLRLRLTAHAVAGLPRDCARSTPDAVTALGEHAERLVGFYEELAQRLGPGHTHPDGPLAPPMLPDEVAATTSESRQAIWLREHLDHLADNMSRLAEPAGRLAQVRQRPWWR